MNTVLVTGATGFTGSHALEALHNQEGIKVVAACRKPSELPDWFTGESRCGDLMDKAYVDELVRGVDVLCHAAAWTSLWNHAEQSRTRFLEPTLRLVEQAKAAGVRRIVFISTTSAAAPDNSSDPQCAGIARGFWPHLSNVVAIEDRLRELADAACCVVVLRLGLFAGQRYNLGLLPILLPRLRTHLVPWVAGGGTGMPIIDGRDIGQAIALAAVTPDLEAYQAFNIVGPEIPSVREVIEHLHSEYGYPTPHFSVPFPIAHAFAWLMERIDPVVPWEPLVTRSIIHLLRNTGADNARAQALLGYRPRHHWKDAIALQIREMDARQRRPMQMAVP